MTDEQKNALCERGLANIFDSGLRESISNLIEDVRLRGDQAVCDALARFDGISLSPAQLKVSAAEIADAQIDPALENAIVDAISHLRAFNDQLMERSSDWQMEIEFGLTAGEKITPISSVGLFVPSGKASYPSVAYQLAVPAVVAGVPNIVLVVPPIPGGNGEVDPAVLVICRLLGITQVFRINGPAGIAALGFGTESIPKVRKVVGPGSPAVTLAQVEMQRHGLATMMLLGPTESLVLADHTAHAGKLASDLLIEAEHGTDSSVVFVCTSETLIDEVEVELQQQIADLPEVRATACRASLGDNGGAILVSSLQEGIAVINMYAPEHCQIAVSTQDEDQVIDGIVNAGEVLIGQHTPFSAGNFVIGVPASLPTSGFAHVSSGITVNAFLKHIAIAKANETALRRMAPTIIAMAEHEGFTAHGNAIHRRLRQP